jgi:hypothetical protein
MTLEELRVGISILALIISISALVIAIRNRKK